MFIDLTQAPNPPYPCVPCNLYCIVSYIPCTDVKLRHSQSLSVLQIMKSNDVTNPSSSSTTTKTPPVTEKEKKQANPITKFKQHHITSMAPQQSQSQFQFQFSFESDDIEEEEHPFEDAAHTHTHMDIDTFTPEVSKTAGDETAPLLKEPMVHSLEDMVGDGGSFFSLVRFFFGFFDEGGFVLFFPECGGFFLFFSFIVRCE